MMALTGCGAQESGSASSEASGDQLERMQQAGEIVIATEGTWSPWTFHDENDELVGYDVEVGKLIAEELGVEPVFVEGEWDGLFAGLDAERYDVVINGVEVTEERAEAYDFSDPYAYIRTAIIVNGDNNRHQFLRGPGRQDDCQHPGQHLCHPGGEGYGATATGVDDLNRDHRAAAGGPCRRDPQR